MSPEGNRILDRSRVDFRSCKWFCAVTTQLGRVLRPPRVLFSDREVRVERHGSESYFVIGEGLLGESLGGRRLARTGAAAAVPQFHFSRLGPKGTGKQLGEPNRRKIAEAMTV